MNENLLLKEYKKLDKEASKVYVVPRINTIYRDTNYLYLLYKDFLEQSEKDSIQVESLSFLAHPKFAFSKLSGVQCLLHYHWFEATDVQSLVGIVWKLFWITFFRLIGGKIVWTIHNKSPHHKKFVYLNALMRRYFAHIAHRLHVHCQSAIDIMSPILHVDTNKFFIVPLPEYPVQVFPKETARKFFLEKNPDVKLKVNQKVFLVFGAIAEYKGIADIIEIFKNEYSKNILIVAGPVKRWDRRYLSKIQKQKGTAENIFILDRMIPESDVPLFMNMADYVLFNYRNILTSAGVQLALNYKKSIIIPSMGCLQELRGENIYSFDPTYPFAFKEVLLSLK